MIATVKEQIMNEETKVDKSQARSLKINCHHLNFITDNVDMVEVLDLIANGSHLVKKKW